MDPIRQIGWLLMWHSLFMYKLNFNLVVEEFYLLSFYNLQMILEQTFGYLLSDQRFGSDVTNKRERWWQAYL